MQALVFLEWSFLLHTEVDDYYYDDNNMDGFVKRGNMLCGTLKLTVSPEIGHNDSDKRCGCCSSVQKI